MTRKFCDICDKPAFDLKEELKDIKVYISDAAKDTNIRNWYLCFKPLEIKACYDTRYNASEKFPDLCASCILDLTKQLNGILQKAIEKNETSKV